MFSPPFSSADVYLPALRERGFAVLDAPTVRALSGASAAGVAALAADWDQLSPDDYLKDGGRYRQRRHASFIADAGEVQDVAYRPHWQPVDYNALHGGMDRWFAPIEPATIANPAWAPLLLGIAGACSRRMPVPRWHIEAHQFRIDTSDGLGRPTPEGAHRDGVDFVAVLLVGRHAIKGGETRIFDFDGPHGLRFTLDQPWSMMLLEDARIIHESTPIQPLDEAGGHRDTLVLTFRASGFLGDDGD